MSRKITTEKWQPESPQAGFSLVELLVTMVILLAVMSVIMSAVVQTARTEGTIANRTEMHASVRSATELLQQEIGQAGRITLPVTVALTGTVPAANAGTSGTVGVTSTSGMFVGEQLVVDNGSNQETVTVTALGSNAITAVFNNFTTDHAIGAPVTVQGGFASGVVPTTMKDAGGNNIGSTGVLLKLYGDINSDGNMVYIEYNCDTAGGNLYRNTMSVSAASKPVLTSLLVLLPNILANPDGSACFNYQQKTVVSNGVTNDYIVNVAVTLTVQTQMQDPQTRQYQTETKALLNVSPRNVFNVWELASAASNNRIQPMPSSVCLLAGGTSC